MNSVTIIGRLCADPELRRTQSGTACCSFSLAVKRPKVKDTTDFLNFVVWQQGAEYLCQYGHKGDLVGVTGYFTTRNWEDKNGSKRIAYEVTCDGIELLSSKRSDNTQQGAQRSQNQPGYMQQSYGGYAPIENDDPSLPF